MRKSYSNILITGGAGYIGSHIAEKLVDSKNNIIIIDNLATGFKKLINKKAKFFKIESIQLFIWQHILMLVRQKITKKNIIKIIF